MTEIWLLQQLQDKFTKIVNQDINMMILWVCRSHSFVVVSCILIWYVLTLTKARPPWPSSQPELNELRAEALNNALLIATALHVFFNDNECTKSPKSLGTNSHFISLHHSGYIVGVQALYSEPEQRWTASERSWDSCQRRCTGMDWKGIYRV